MYFLLLDFSECIQSVTSSMRNVVINLQVSEMIDKLKNLMVYLLSAHNVTRITILRRKADVCNHVFLQEMNRVQTIYLQYL